MNGKKINLINFDNLGEQMTESDNGVQLYINLTEDQANQQFIAMFNRVADLAHKNLNKKNSVGESISEVHLELSKVLESFNQKNPPYSKIKDFSSAEIKMANVILLIMNLAEKHGFDLGQAVLAKHQYNCS